MAGRASALVGLGTALALYYAVHDDLWNAGSVWWDVAFLALVLIPACFGLVWLLLPLRTGRGLLGVAISLGALAWAFNAADWRSPENFSKLLAVTALAFWFLGYFEAVSWVVLVSLIIPWVDAYSVFAPSGPTKQITEHHEEVFTTLSFAFPAPGEPSTANLGLPDLLFFALFLAASSRFGLRPFLTWVLMTLSFGASFALAVALEEHLRGVPALPLLSLGFLAANADILWARLRSQRAGAGS